MTLPLLTTKLYIPSPRLELVPRPRLIERLEGGLHRKLTLISAPAGFGKTTLLSECAAKCGYPIAWLSLDEEDNDATRFWMYLIAALQTVYVDLGKEEGQLIQTHQPPAAQAILIPLLNDVAALSNTLVLVLDDYHVISNRAIHDGILFLLEHQPQQLHLVISTRADPPLPVGRLRARGQLTELRADDLRFTSDEAATFLNEMMGLGLTAQDVKALEARTEGWIVGLQLAALSMQGRKDIHEFVAAFTGGHHYVLEYLTEEVVYRQSESVQQFLLETSILDRLSGSLCNAVTYRDDGDATLERLQRNNLFVVPLDDEYHWYRYHHLFADLLGNLLRKELSLERVRELHQRASEWYEQNGDPDNAIKHALQAQNFEQAASLIEQIAQAKLAHGKLITLIRWIDALPEDLLRTQLRLRLYQGWALNLSGQSDLAEQILQDARATLQTLPPSPENKALHGRLMALLTGIATQREEMVTVIQQAQEALTYLPEEDRISRARVYVALGTAYAYENDLEKAVQTWQQAKGLALDAGNPFLATAAIEMLAGMQIYHQGRLRAGRQTLQQVLDLATTPDGTRLPFSGTAHALLAEVYLEWNDLKTATGYLETGIELLRQGGISYGLIHTFCAKARLERAMDNTEGAVQALQTTEQALGMHSLWHMILHLASCQVRLWLCLGNVEMAARWAKGDPAIIKREMPDTLPIYLQEVQKISLAWVHLARQETEQVLATLEGFEEQAQAAGRLAQVIEICLLKALALQARGESAAAQVPFERCLTLAEPEGYVRLFLEAGEPVVALLQQAASRGICPAYASKLLSAFGEKSPSAPLLLHTFALVEPLTKRECQVLQLICEGCSNQQISERLVVTMNTVKKHTSNIYSKLDVKRRTQAVARARELGLC
jgi:LuxR family maltose regulon positive regulatory protein